MYYTNADLLRKANERAAAAGLPKPRTVEDVENLTGFVYNGPAPESIGKTFSVKVRQYND